MKTRNNTAAITITLPSPATLQACLLLLFFIAVTTITSAQSPTSLVKIDTRLCFGNAIVDANVVVFDPAYSNAVDGDDAYKMSNASENIAIQRGTALLVVEGRQPAVVNDAIPFKIWNLRQQTYRLEFTASNLSNTGLVQVLEDAYLNTSTTLSNSGTTSVNFTVNSTPASAASNRFRIVFKPASPLPVTFVSLDASCFYNRTELTWEVADELNIKNYEVERSADGIHFSTAGTIIPTIQEGTGHYYHYSDVSPCNTVTFYRIKSTDLNGEIKFSTILRVASRDNKQAFIIIGNPVINGSIHIAFKNQPAGSYQFALFNADGKKITSGIITHTGNTGNQSIDLPQNTRAGIYWLQLAAPGNTGTTQMLLIGNR